MTTIIYEVLVIKKLGAYQQLPLEAKFKSRDEIQIWCDLHQVGITDGILIRPVPAVQVDTDDEVQDLFQSIKTP